MGSALKAGLDQLSIQQEVTFDLYARVVLPLDGFVFWVKASLLGPSALYNAQVFNASQFNEPQEVITPAPQVTVKGSLHYSTDTRQTEEANYAVNRVVFSAENPVADLNSIGSELIYIAELDGPPAFQGAQEPRGTTAIRFAFSSRSPYYRQANLWHYIGMAVYPTMASQVIDDPRTLSTRQLIVSNSLPIWLRFNSYDPPWPVPVPRPRVVMYPSMLVPDNLEPPYVSVHIDEGDTSSDQVMPFMDRRTNTYSLARDRARLTLYGFNNLMASDFRDSLMQFTLDDQSFGITSMPVLQDVKEGQSELSTLAQKKRFSVEVSYNQAAVRDIARQLILTCIPTVQVA